ncbi:hypothetical protein [Kitasatospora sp. NPDC101183]|uniref:hypothetical protein n=1 Tax=Kitasatospora sp. NPDC101183 TaxID=3364100 RepID=UPI0038197CD5
MSTTPPAPAVVPDDVEPAPRALMTLPGMCHDVRRWRLVEIRRAGRWQSALLTVWRRPPGATGWGVHLRWGPDDDSVSGEPWCWALYDPPRSARCPNPLNRPPRCAATPSSCPSR